MLTNLFYFFALICFSSLTWFAIVSILEKEKRAVSVSFIFAIILSSVFVVIAFSSTIIQLTVLATLIACFFAMLIGFIWKNPNPKTQESNFQIDERDTMFSRKEIGSSKEKKADYYAKNPDKHEIDEAWRKKPGLMAENSSNYNALAFAAADASFSTIEDLRQSVKPNVSHIQNNLDTQEISEFIKEWSKKMGCISIGFCELKPQHLYSHRGRGDEYGKAVDNKHTHAIALTVEMDKDFLSTGPASPTVMESAQQYLNSGTIAIQIAKFLANIGYEARAHIDGNYEVICPLIARDAGLGEIGRMGLLMTPELGPRVRIAVISTNMPLETTKYKHEYSVESFCSICEKCAHNCPTQAIPYGKQKAIQGSTRWQINQEKCFSYWCKTGTDCGRCMSICPYSHPNNLLHNIVRWGIKKNILFRHIALHLDNIFYSKKPKPTKTPDWI